LTKDKLTSSTPLNPLRNLPTEFYETWCEEWHWEPSWLKIFTWLPSFTRRAP